MEAQKNEAQNQPKKPYIAPQLTVHGTVGKITGAVGVTGSDGTLGSRLV